VRFKVRLKVGLKIGFTVWCWARFRDMCRVRLGVWLMARRRVLFIVRSSLCLRFGLKPRPMLDLWLSALLCVWSCLELCLGLRAVLCLGFGIEARTGFRSRFCLGSGLHN
jgi:hypothetical protein